MSNYKVFEDVRIRFAPSLRAATMKDPNGKDMYLPANGVINVLSTLEAEGHTWARYLIEAGDLAMREGFSCVVRARDKFTWMKPVDEVIVKPSSETFADKARRIVGIHDLCCGGALEAARLGATVVKIFNDATGAFQLAEAFPNCRVVHRRHFTSDISAEDLLAQHGINPRQVDNKIRILIEGPNENDVRPYGSDVEGIRQRARLERRMVELTKKAAPNSNVLGFCVAHGNPDFTNPAICQVVKEEYAPLYNSGDLWIGMHNYFKSNPGNPKDWRYYGPEWFQARWRFLFTHCGFDPRIRHILPSEAGGECGQGGMAWAGFSHDELWDYLQFDIALQTEPIIVNGVAYPSPVAGSTHFQLNGTNYKAWQGYELRGYMAVIQRAYNYVMPREIHAPDLTTKRKVAPKNYMPAPKLMPELA